MGRSECEEKRSGGAAENVGPASFSAGIAVIPYEEIAPSVAVHIVYPRNRCTE
jgi:hypothetical protein